MLSKGDKVEFIQMYDYLNLKVAMKNNNLRIVKGFVIDTTKNYVIVQTENYRECFKWDEVNRKLFRRGEAYAKLKRIIED